jgi:hypothetical protein
MDGYTEAELLKEVVWLLIADVVKAPSAVDEVETLRELDAEITEV